MIKRLTYFISLLILPSITLAQFQTKAELQAAVNLWVSNNATALSTYGEINTWDVSQITDMSELFRDKTTFNDDISNWNVSSVTDMEYMFFNAEAFNQPLNDWDVSSVTDMERMFESADIFNQDISNWNVSNVTTMRKMFQSATSFNQAVNDWDVSSVTDMVYMFMFADAFNQDLNDWNVSSVTSMGSMFRGADNFDGDVTSWNVSSVTSMSSMFQQASSFNKDISNWNVSNVTSTRYMFSGANSFNQTISNWAVGNVTNMEYMFGEATSFNQDIGGWDVSSVTDMGGMFYYASNFNQNLNDWNVSNVTDMALMFENADVFNQDISNWNVSNVTTMYKMFQGADDFNQDISGWNVSSVTNMVYMFMLSAFNQDISGWNVSSVTNMNAMFRDANSFNQDISGWNVSSVTNMTDMFVGTDDLSNENKCAIQRSFQSNSAWPYDWSAACYDYKWFSSDSSGGPVYSWQDITSTGTLISMSGDDNNTGPHPIGFTFPFYGTEYTTFRISTNGWVSFTNTSSDYNNQELPGTSSPEAMLAPFWDDLNFQSDKAYYYSDGSQLVITFNDVPRLGQESSSSYTFQVILSATGEIVYQYNTMTGPLNGATIGWQDDTRTQGTSIVYNNTNYALIHNSWAISIIDINAGVTPPTGFAATPSYQTATLSWTASTVDSVSSYVIYRGSTSSSLAAYDSVASTVTTYIDSNLTNGTTYYYGLKSKTPSGQYSIIMPLANTTPRVVAPSNLTASVSISQVALSWTAATGSGVARTLVYQGTSSSSLSLVDSTSDGTTTTKTITGLTNNTTYYFYLRSRGDDGTLSSVTSTVEATPLYTGPVWWVATNGSDSNDGTQSNPFSSISAAYTAAAAGDTIKLKSGTFTGSSNRNITLSKNLVITSSHGPDSTILDANSVNRHFYFGTSGDTLTHIIGLTLKNSSGSSFYIEQSSPRITNCVFKSNVSNYYGGAVYIQGGSEVKAEPLFTNCTFRDNQSGDSGGAIYMTGGSSDNQSTPRFVGCTIISNDVLSDFDAYRGGSGGGISSQGEMRPAFVDCQIDSNTVAPGYSDGRGGAAYVYGYNGGAVTTFTRCTFRGNTVTPNRSASGGALYVSNGEIELTNCLISGNSAVGGGSSYNGRAGGIFIHQYMNYSEGSYEASESKIINCTIVNNSASSGGSSSDYPGGAHFEGSNATVTMFNTIVWGNTSDDDNYNSIQYNSGSVVLAADYNNIENYYYTLGSNSFEIDPLFTNAATGDFTLSDASPIIGAGTESYEGYTAPGNDLASATRPNPSGSDPDMGAYENSLSATPYPNPVSGVTGTVAHQSAVLTWTASSEDDVVSYKVYKSTTSGFTPATTDLVSTVTHPTVTYTVTGLTNGTTYYFRVSAVDEDSYEGSYSSEISVVPAYSGPAWWVATDGSDSNEGSQSNPFVSIIKGYTVASTGDTVKVKKGTYTGSYNRNLNFSSGKNIVLMSTDGADSTAIDAGNVTRHFSFSGEEDTTFKVVGFTLKNGLSSSGGSIYISNASPQFNNCTISDNKSSGNGGAIYINNNEAAPIFNNCVITSNVAESDAGDYNSNYGGGIYIGSGSPTFNDCRISYNTASSGDYSSNGGGVFINWFDNREYDPVTFNRCQFIGNTLTPDDGANGGGLNIHARTVLSSCLIAGNTATAGASNSSHGGGLYIDLQSYYNSETELDETGEVAIINCTIVGNTAAVTSTNYSAQGGGIYSGYGENVTMFNSIVWDNTATSYTDVYFNNSSGSVSADYNDIEDGTDESYFGSYSLDKDPGFTNASSGDYSLAISSDLIGAGTATYGSYSAPTKDVAGSARPNPSNSTVDIGAYESSYATSPYPDAPSGLTATAGDGSVVLTWTAHSETDVAKYGLYYGTSSGPTVKQAEVSGRTTVTTTVSDLSNNVTYYFRITAIDGDSYESSFSSEVSSAPTFSGSTIYVDNSGSEPSNPDGSENNAFYSIQDAIDAEATTNGKRILVKAGTYTGSGSSSIPVIDLKGKNIIIESDAGPATTIIDAGGNRIALSLDYQYGNYSGYSASATKFVGLTFTNGDDDKSLIDINGPNPSNSNISWDITFENCRFTNTDNDYGDGHSIVYVGRSSSVFDGCQFRDLNISGSFSNNNSVYAPIKLQGEDNWYYNSGTNQSYRDTTVYRPQFKNCVIAENGIISTAGNSLDFDFYCYGGGIYVGYGAVPYFENTRIDSNIIDGGGNSSVWGYGNTHGGGIYVARMYDNGPPIKFVNCSISNNTVKGMTAQGGGIFTGYGQMQFINTVITNNLAYGAYTNAGASISVSGAGIDYRPGYWGSSDDNLNYPSSDRLLTLVNVTIANNKIKYVYNQYGYQWGGAGIYRWTTDDNVLIMNSIIHNNYNVSATGYNNKTNLSTNNNSWQSSGSTVGYSFIEHAADAGVDGDEVYEYSPAFSDTANGNFSLSIASLAIGAGVSEYEDVDAPAYDYNNSVRPNPTGSNPDLGAFENSLSATPYPGVPQTLTAASVGDSTVTLSWTAGTEDDLVRYRIYYGTSSPATTLKDSASASATSKAVGGLTNGTEYVFRITALDGDGYESGYSNEVEGTPAYKGPVWYVDDGGSSSGEGSSSDPMREIQDAIYAAAAGDTVLVLPGTYDRNGDQELEFATSSSDDTGKNIVLKSRDGAATTILDGEGSKRLFQIDDNTDTTLQIIGFTIKNGGYSNGSAIRVEGDQHWTSNSTYDIIYSGATFKNCIISDNDESGSTPILLYMSKVYFIDCIIKDNSNINTQQNTQTNGGAGDIYDSHVVFDRCQITDNEAEAGCWSLGGAFIIGGNETRVKFINSVIARNSVTANAQGCPAGGGAFAINYGANVTIINSTVVDNTTENSYSAGHNWGGFAYLNNYNDENPIKLTVFNSIIDNMLTYDGTPVFEEGNNFEYRISYSIYTGVDADDYDEEDYVYTHTPAFIDTVDVDPADYYQLHPRSLVIGAGASTGEDAEEHTINAPTVDIAGNARPNPTGSNPDLGAYESALAITPYPDAPSALAGTASHQSVSLSWTAPDEDDVVKYFVYQADSTSSGWSSWAIADTLDSLTSTATTITGLTNERLYGFYVTSVDNSDYESSASSLARLTPTYLGPVWYVDANDGGVSAEGSPGDPFRDLQDAIDVSSAGDTVLVLPGTYAGNRSDNRELEFVSGDGSAKNIVLKSRDGAATTFIDSRNSRSFDFDDGTDTSLQIIGFTITSTTGGEDDAGGALVKIQGQSYWNQETQESYWVPSSATFRNCIFTIFDSGSLQGEDLQDVAVNILSGGAIFDNCEFTNITVDYDDYSFGNLGGGAIKLHCGELYINRSKLTNITVTRSTGGGVYGAAIQLGACDTELTIINTIIADNLVSYTGGSGEYTELRGGAINSFAYSGNIQLINSTVVNNTVSSTSSSQDGPIQGSAIFAGDWQENGSAVYLTIFNSIIHGNRKVMYAGSSSEVRTNYGQIYLYEDNNDGVEGYASYSLIGGVNNIEGDEILNLEPEFLDSTYALHPRSPAIGAGAVQGEDADGNTIHAPTEDIAGNMRPNPADDDEYENREAVPDLGAWENELAVTPYPDAPANIFAIEDHQSVQLFWDASDAEDVVEYKIYFSADSITFSLADSISGRYNTESSVSGLTNEEYYWFYVTSVDSNNYESSPSMQEKAKPHFQGPKWYVDKTDGSISGEGSPEEPMRDIQDAIDASDEGDTVLVLPGTYDNSDDQNLTFYYDGDNNQPKHIVLISRGGPDSTIIDCEGSESAFVLNSATDTTLQIIGFKIINGWSQNAHMGSAISIIPGSQAVFKNCIIEDGDGYGPAICIMGGTGIFRDCVIRNNRHEAVGNDNLIGSDINGGGFFVTKVNWCCPEETYHGKLVLDRSKVVSNYIDHTGPITTDWFDCFPRGAGIFASDAEVSIRNSLIADNYFTGANTCGSAVAGLDGVNSEITLINSTITGNQGYSGDNTGPSGFRASNYYYEDDDYDTRTIIFNTIIAGNTPNSYQTDFDNAGTDYFALENSIFENSTDHDWFDPDDGHYDFDPLLNKNSTSPSDWGESVNSTTGDTLYTPFLSEYSRAIGRGGSSIEDADENDLLAPSIDLLGNPRPNPAESSPDLGAYEHVRSDYRRAVYYVDDANGDDEAPGLTIATAVKSIANALTLSSNRDTLELAAGTYSGADNRNLNMDGLTRIIRTSSGPASTIIDCENQGPAFVFDTDEPDSVHISGLTIINGSSENGGAISIDGADPVFENMIFRDNNSDGNGGAVYASDSYSSFTNCVFVGNHADQGGAFYLSGGDVSLNHCTLLDNTADDDSGIKNASGDLSVMNSIYWGNDEISGDVGVSYSNVMGGYDGTMNFNGRPGFTDAENGDLTLLDWSPMIGRGSTVNIISADIASTARADSVAPDLGAYENSLDSPSTYSPVTWHVATTGIDTVVYSNIASITAPFSTLQWTMDHMLEGDSIIVHPGDHAGSADNLGKSVHIRGNTFSADEVSVLGELEFIGGSNSVNMLRVSNASGDGFTISAGSINIADVLVDNSSGKAISLSDTASAVIARVTLYGNTYGLYDNSSGSVTMINSIVWGTLDGQADAWWISGNPVVTYSNIQDGYTGTGNIDSNPLFVAASNNNFELDLLSPCIDSGDPTAVYDPDSTVADMGAFPRLRQFLGGTSTEDINVSADTTVIITEDFTVAEGDSIVLESGAELYFGPGVTLTVEGSLTADGSSDGVISFLPLDPDSTFGGVVIDTDDGGRDGDSYSYIQISGVEAASIPLTVNGSATLSHVTIAGNGNPKSLLATDVVDLNYSILEGTVDGTVNNTGSFISSTDQFNDYDNDDFTLLAAAAGIDTDTNRTDPDYSYADAGAYYHDQTDYPVTAITIHRPAYGDTILVSPDTSSVTGSISIIQLFNAYDRYKTNGVVSWNNSNAYGSFMTDSTNTTDLDGMISNVYVTNTVSSTHNSFSVRVGDVTSTSGQFLVEPGIPDSVWVTEQVALNMTQLDSLTFTANVYDQFANPVRLGESATWSVNTVSGSGEGYTLSTESVSTDASGAVAVTLYTDPTSNSLSVGDQVTIEVASGPGSHSSGVVTIIPSDIYNLAMDEEYTGEQLNVSADTAYMDFYTALIDTFDNPLENVEVFWEVVTGQGTGESLSASSSNTNTSGVATVRLNTNTVADLTYQVRCWVTETSLLNAFGSFEALASNVMNWNNTTTLNTTSTLVSNRGISRDRNRIIDDETSRRRRGQFVPVQIGRPTTVARNVNRDAVYDLDDTTATVLVWPGVTASVSVPQTATNLLLEDEFGFTLDAYDQFSNLVRDNTPVSWVITPSSANVSIVSSDDNTANGQATISLQVASNAVWDFSFTITATIEGISAETGAYRIDDVTAPTAVSSLSIDPIVWTSTNNFTLTWNNPSEHSGVAGAYYEIAGESSVYVAGSGIQTLNFSLPVNDERTVKLWLQDNAANEDVATAMTITAKWDDTAPNSFDLTKPLAGWYNDANYRFEWEASSDATAGLDHYVWSLNSGDETATISPDSTGHTPSFGLAQGTHTWTVTAYDSSGNLTETSNPQSIQVDHTPPEITHNPVLEATENSAVVINAVFTEDGTGQSGIETAELYYRKGGETNWQPPVDMTTLNTYQIASSFSTSAGLEYYLHAVDVAGNITDKPVEGFTSISVTITGGLASTDRWPTGIPNGTEVSSYQLWSFPGNPASSSPVDLLVDDLGDYDNTVWRLFSYGGGGAWTEFESLSKLNNGESYFIIVKDEGFSINTGQIYTIATDQPFEINLTSGDWTFVGNPFDFNIPLTGLYTTDSTSLSGDPNFYTYDGSWSNASSLEPWKGYIYKNPSASKLYINPSGDSGGMLGRQLADEIIIENNDNEWLVNISARNGLGRDNFNEVGLLVDAVDTYDNHDAFEPPLVPGGISVRVDNRNWPEYADTYTRDIRAPKEDGEYWDLEILAQDDEHNVYLTFENLNMIPEDLDVFAIDLTLGTAQDLRWRHVYRYAVPNPQEKHNVRFIAGTKDFLQKNNAGVELFPDRYSLSQNYPNPFNPQTSILLTMQDGATVNLVVYNLLGEKIAVLADNEYRPAGYHNFIWKGLNNNGQRVASGVYFYMAKIVSPKGEVLISDTHKMVLVK